MALEINIEETQYKRIEGKDHLFYFISITQKATEWEGTKEVRYSDLKYMHRQIEK
jgi:hypothetical protein